MYLFDFIHKLKKLNSNLYVNTDLRTKINEEWTVTGIYDRLGGRVKQRVSDGTLHYNKHQAGKYLKDIYNGTKDMFICGIPLNWVPEYTIFDLETGEILAKGWRSILLQLLQKQLIEKEYTKKVFNCQSLGNCDYDLMSTQEKLNKAREEQLNARCY